MAEAAGVIELGSSDDEPEPAPRPTSTPPSQKEAMSQSNSMVIIPNAHLQGLTIKRQSPKKLPPIKPQIIKPAQGMLKNPFANRPSQILNMNISNNGKGYMPVRLPQHPIRIQSPVNIKNIVSNVVKKMNPTLLRQAQGLPVLVGRNNSHVRFKTVKIPGQPVQIAPHVKVASVPIRNPVQGNFRQKLVMAPHLNKPAQTKPEQKCLNKLPPGITVTRTTGQPKRKRDGRVPLPGNVLIKKRKVHSAFEVTTVELDDDEPEQPSESSTNIPQWYVPPENSKTEEDETPEENVTSVENVTPATSMELENNKELQPEKQMIEITIEDSPIKPPVNKQTAKIACEFPIIIEDSPKKLEEARKTNHEEERSSEDTKSPKMRKKLIYPRNSNNQIEIEVEFCKPFDIPIEMASPRSEENDKAVMDKTENVVQQLQLETKEKKRDRAADIENPELNESPKQKESKKEVSSNTSNAEESPKYDQEPFNSVQESSKSAIELPKSIAETTMSTPESSKLVCESVKLVPQSSNSVIDSLKSVPEVPNDKPESSKSVPESSKSVQESSKPGSSKESPKFASVSPETQAHNFVEIDLCDSPLKSSIIFKNKENDSPSPRKFNVSELPKDCIPGNSKSISTGEFSETYQEFIDLCFELENSADMNKIVEKKVKEYYRQVDKDYTESEDFVDMVSAKIKAMRLNPDNMYLYIKDIVDELKIRRKTIKALTKEKNKEIAEDSTHSDGDEGSDSSQRPSRNIRKLEKTLRKLHRAIQKLEEQEVDFDDDTDSVYLLTESKDGNSSHSKQKATESERQIQMKRYKARLVRVHSKLCQMTGTKMPSESKVKLEVRPGCPQGPTLKLEKWINKKVPAGAPLPFPDFHDVLRCVKEANDEDRLGWSEMEMKDEARDLFARCGKKLQKRRQENEWRIASSRISTAIDPAECSPDLQRKLAENKKIASKKEADVIDKYADRQKQLQLEAVEIAENAEESAPSSDDDIQMIEDEAYRTNRPKVSPLKEKEIKQEKILDKQMDIDYKDIVESSVIREDVTNKRPVSEETYSHENDVQSIKVNRNGDINNLVKISDEESESEQLKLGLSDVNESEAETKGSNSDGQSLLEKAYSQPVSSTLESSDNDTPNTLSTDNAILSAKSSNVVSIENSSESETNKEFDTPLKVPYTNFCSPEKQLLLDIDNSEDDNEPKSKIASDDALSNENVLVASSDESEIGEGKTNVTASDISAEILIEDTKSGAENSSEKDERSPGEQSDTIHKSLSDFHNSDEDIGKPYDECNVNTDNSQFADDNLDENVDKAEEAINLDTENSNSHVLTPDTKHSSSDNQNLEAMLDIGPTVVEGGCIDSEISNSNSAPEDNINALSSENDTQEETLNNVMGDNQTGIEMLVSEGETASYPIDELESVILEVPEEPMDVEGTIPNVESECSMDIGPEEIQCVQETVTVSDTRLSAVSMLQVNGNLAGD